MEELFSKNYVGSEKTIKAYSHTWCADQGPIGSSIVPNEKIFFAKNLGQLTGALISDIENSDVKYTPVLGPYKTEMYFLDQTLIVYNEMKKEFVDSAPTRPRTLITVIGSEKKDIVNAARTLELPLEDLI